MYLFIFLEMQTQHLNLVFRHPHNIRIFFLILLYLMYTILEPE